MKGKSRLSEIINLKYEDDMLQKLDMQQIVGNALSFDLTPFSFKSDVNYKRGSDALKTLIFSGNYNNAG